MASNMFLFRGHAFEIEDSAYCTEDWDLRLLRWIGLIYLI